LIVQGFSRRRFGATSAPRAGNGANHDARGLVASRSRTCCAIQKLAARHRYVTQALQCDVSLAKRKAIDVSVQWQVRSNSRSNSLAWSNPVAWWWGLLSLVSSANIAVWCLLFHELRASPAGSLDGASGIDLMLLLCAAYVFGCAFRSFLPRADIQRICLFDTWLSSVVVGRSVATVAEICFAAQWAIVLLRLGAMTGAVTTLNAAWLLMVLIVIAECISWYAVLTTNYLGNAIENSIWGVAFCAVGIGLVRLLADFDGSLRVVLVAAIIGIAGYVIFLVAVDVPMYVGRWRARGGNDSKLLTPLQGLRDASTRWIVTHDLAQWKDEIPWMSLYFSAAVWASLALCVLYALFRR
jgi:hypothetical protein